ncbi:MULTISPECIES: DUF3000 domain-containing protein [Isoptericola]|uniref:DUF3000 domain-containing protein n=1 Tax=Isoptericola haloaureus TaxID=1542902 RepID=A0ABU7Z6W5_9MICO|nr:DUF3000 domain-containing protein [Isoptericola sp. AK164]
MTASPPDVPERFAAALASLRGRRTRPEVRLSEIPGPRRVAPFSLALEGEVISEGVEIATGRFVVLHDPAGQEQWHGDFRVVTLVRAELEAELAADEMLGDVAWTWVTENLESAQVGAIATGGTVTRVLSQSYGALASTPDAVDLEIRASWTPTDTDLGAHLEVWADLMSTAGGLPPLPDGVTALDVRRRTVEP